MLDVARIRQDFPILSQLVNGKPLVYLDSAATSQKPWAVIRCIENYYTTANANVHRSIHTLGERATAMMEEGRAKVARFIGAQDPATLIFTRNASESINLVAYSWGFHFLKPGDVILLSPMEHHSNLVPWLQAAARTGARVEYLPMHEDATLDLSGLAERLAKGDVKMLAVTHVSNVVATINPVKEIAHLAHKHGALVLVDGAQSAAHMPVDVVDLDCDFFVFTGHKMLAPTGIGALYGKRELLEAMPPFLFGGEMISSVTYEEATWNALPWKFEAGTPNIEGMIAFGAAVDYLSAIGMDAIRQHDLQLTAYALEKLQEVPDLKIHGPMTAEQRGGLVSFSMGELHPHDIAAVLDSEGIAVRAGNHCAQPLTQCLGVPATTRASFYLYNTEAEIDRLAAALVKAKEFFAYA